jgi:hypothetical protein
MGFIELREAAQQALEALENPWAVGPKGVANAITALRAALAEPEPFSPDWDRIEPLQENLREHMAEIQRLRAKLAEPCPCGDRSAAECPGEWEPGCDLGNNPKYAKRVNLAEPVQEPFCYHDGRNIVGKEYADHSDVFPLYTAPPQRKPLTEEEIREMFFSELRALPSYPSAIEELPERLARAIERARGIGGQP